MTSPTALLDTSTETPMRRATRRRTADRVPDLIGVAVVCVVILLGYFEVPFAGKTFSTASTIPGLTACRQTDRCAMQDPGDPRVDPGASATQMEAWGHVVHRTLDGGEVPLWNPYQGIGAPLAGDMPTGVFDPMLVAFHIHPTLLVQDLTFLAALLLIGVAAYWAARMLQLGPLAATVSGCVYGLSGWFFEYSNNEWFWTFLYLPVMLALGEWCLRTNRRLPVVLLGVAMASMVFAGMPELFFVALVALSVYLLARLFIGPRAHTRPIAAFRLLLGSALGLALSAPATLLFAEYLPLSYNQHSRLAGLSPATDPFDLLVNWMVPKISPIASGDYGSTRTWVGMTAIVLVAVAISSPRAMRRYAAWPAAVMGGVLVLQIYGGSLVAWTRVLPFWSAVNWPGFGTPIIALALALLAAVGVQSVHDDTVVVRRFLIALGALVLLVAICLVTTDRDLALAHDVFVVGGWPLAVAVAMIGIGACLWLDRRRGAVVLAGLVIVELLLLAPRGFYAPRDDPYRKTDLIAFLQNSTHGDQSRVFSTDGILTPDTPGAFGLSDPRMVDALYIDRYWKYLRSFVSHGLEDRFVASGSAESAPAIAANQMFDLLGIRYLMFRADSAGPPGWSNPQYRLVYADSGIKVYENTHAAPRAFVVHDVHRTDAERGALRYLRRGEVGRFPDGSVQVTLKDMERTAVVEADRGESPKTRACAGSQDSARIVARTANSVKLTVDSECAGLLVLSDAYYPGWTATVNDHRAQIFPTDLALRGVEVSRGRSTIVFGYQPAMFRVGRFLAGLAVVVVLGVAITALVASRRGRSR